jgi:integrase
MKTILTESRRPREGEISIHRIRVPERGSVEFHDTRYPGLALRVTATNRRTWYHFYRFGGKLVRRKLGVALDLDEAIDLWHDDKRDLRDGIDPKRVTVTPKTVTYAEAVDDFIRRYSVGEKGNKHHEMVRRLMMGRTQAWHDRDVRSITAAMVGALVESTRDQHPYASNRLHQALSTFFKWCERESVGYVDRSPASSVPKPFHGEKPRTRYFSLEEIGMLWRSAAKLDPFECAYLRTLILTGKRKTALASMKWSEIRDGWWHPTDAVDHGKKLNRSIPLSPLALKVLADVPRIEDCPYVFCGPTFDKPLKPDARRAARIGEASGVSDFYYHAVRDTIATHLEEWNVPGNAVRRITDHAQSRDAHQRAYTHSDLTMAAEDAAEAWSALVSIARHRVVHGQLERWLATGDRQERRRRRRELAAALIERDRLIRLVRSICRPQDEKIVKLNVR